MKQNDKIAVFGGKGMVGSAIVRQLEAAGHDNIQAIGSQECNLLRQADVEAWFDANQPDYAFVAAARVGGIMANSTYPAQFLYENLMIQCNVIHSAHLFGIEKLLFIGSTCIYPKSAPQPYKEDALLTGLPEPSNEAYALAKICGLKMCDYYHRQHGSRFISAMPTNLYGYGDNFHPEHSHVIPGLMLRFHEAKLKQAPSVTCWGTGAPKREFLFVDDLADALLFLMDGFEGPGFVNVGTGEDVTIKELSETVAGVVGYQGKILWDASKPDGTPRKVTDMTKLHSMGWRHKTPFDEGLRRTYDWFLQNEESIRR